MGKPQRINVITNNVLTNNDRLISKTLTNNDNISLNTSKKDKSLSLIVNRSNINSSKRNKRGYTPEMARSKAEYLGQKLKDMKSIAFYMKCAWNLTDSYLDTLLATAISSSDGEPSHYFSKVAAREMRNNR